MNNHRAPWTDEAKEHLLELFNQGNDPVAIAHSMGRTVGAIIGQMERMGKVVNEGGKVYKKEFWFDNRRKETALEAYLRNPFGRVKNRHVRAFIEDMKNFQRRGAQYTLEQWQESDPERPGYHRHSDPETVLELGLACNLGGWLALTPHFQSCGGQVTQNGQPILNEVGEYAIAEWLGVPVEIAGALVGTSHPGYHDKVDVSTLPLAVEALERMATTGNPGV